MRVQCTISEQKSLQRNALWQHFRFCEGTDGVPLGFPPTNWRLRVLKKPLLLGVILWNVAFLSLLRRERNFSAVTRLSAERQTPKCSRQGQK
jgi:hypothetical protein